MGYYDGTEVPLVIGSLRGRRNFRVSLSANEEPDERENFNTILWSPQQHFGWTQDENIAQCKCYAHGGERSTHVPGSLNTRCGFYAYTNHKYFEYEHNTQAIGVIEGYGRMTVGDFGFRCQKARILAISFKEPLGFADDFIWAGYYNKIKVFGDPQDMFEEFPLIGMKGEIRVPVLSEHARAFRDNVCPDCKGGLHYEGSDQTFMCGECMNFWTAQYVMATIHDWKSQ